MWHCSCRELNHRSRDRDKVKDRDRDRDRDMGMDRQTQTQIRHGHRNTRMVMSTPAQTKMEARVLTQVCEHRKGEGEGEKEADRRSQTQAQNTLADARAHNVCVSTNLTSSGDVTLGTSPRNIWRERQAQ